eukprot:TRINITY_DN725_c0_g1_i1.p1 TRINITY_DN725_c0_g1~~TRINITY_DN725_c0_g1_i1.p1  ORF type:complete len:222 (+),score=51.60 TRINITY_DN725_c0_g1_i1:53-718(+)
MSEIKRAKPDTLTLHSYWRSSCSWRVRIALAVKGVEYKYEAVNLLKGEQKGEKYVAEKNVMKQVPSLDVGDDVLSQSLAIMEYIEEVYPGPSLLPDSAIDKAKVRELCQIIASGIQPIQNLAVIAKIAADFGEEHKPKWANYWITQGFVSLEKQLQKTAGKYCFGDQITMADACLIPQIYNANRFAVDMTQFPTIVKVKKNLDEVEVIRKAEPENMPDAQK